MLLCLFSHRPAHLTRVHAALGALDAPDRRRLGITADWRSGPHALTYRQVERTFSLVVAALSKDRPDGAPTEALQETLDALVAASVEERFKEASRALAVDWTDVESFSTRRTKPDGHYADHEASWGHRKGGGPGEKDELFFGYYLGLDTMVADEGGKAVPELVRRMTMAACDHDPVPLQVAALVKDGTPLGDVVADSGYAHRVAEHFALPLRAAGASLVMDLHPHDRGMRGTHQGAIACNGNLYCPATPKALFELGPLALGASEEETAAHDRRVAELSRFKLGRISATDDDGFHRVACPAAMGKLRCALRPASLQLAFSHPEVLDPPTESPACCAQQTITVPPSVNAKTAQRHDYLSKPWRHSFARRTAVERSNARIKDPATIDVARGWCRVMGLVPMSLFVACALVVRNLAVADAFEKRQADDERRAQQGRPPRTRRRRRKTLSDLVAATANAPP
ncbi:MAG: hypothetical protein ACRETZ_13000 [Steroidobacteraceae bacterium]